MIDWPIAPAAAGFVISGEHSDAFQRSGFAGAVLADDDRDRPIKLSSKSSRRKGAEPVVTTLVCFHQFAREAAGAAGTRRFLRPLLFEVVRAIPRVLRAAGMRTYALVAV
jgi:hypothetical protein